MSALDGVFYISLSGIICGGFGLLVKLLYKIKCSEVKCCCGCLELKRDVDEELKLDLEGQEDKTSQQKRSSLSLGFNKI